MESQNEKKAHELAENNFKWYYELGISYDECYQSALQAIEWKEKQMVSRVKTFIKEIVRVCDITDENGYRINEHYLLAEIEKAMKGE